MIRIAVLVTMTAQPLQAASYAFCWTGGNGHTMTGRMDIPDALLSRDVITENDVTKFSIAGFQNGTFIGRWDMRDAIPGETTWFLRFRPSTLSFPMGSEFQGGWWQGWNAGGNADDCGVGGFGFNAGSYAQDFCVNGEWIADSGIEPTVPLFAVEGREIPPCAEPLMSSKGANARKDH